MSDDQAKEWSGLEGLSTVGEPLEIFFSAVVCVVCKENYGEALPECLGSPADEDPNEHLWQGFFTHPVTDDEAGAWADPEDEMNIGRPESIAVLCVLCGQSADTADDECDQRTFWTKESTLDLKPGDFAQGGGGEGISS